MRRREPPPPIPTLEEIQRASPWVWADCRCGHRAPMALAAAVILYGRNASSNALRRKARCTRCGGLGASLMHPSWVGKELGFGPLPT